jgi:glycosyltransferase involved in cell wall biosynthesis
MSIILNNQDPEVSVLMCCYNASHWLKESIDSVLSQSFENFEFIIIDDGSTDETWEIILEYQNIDSRIVGVSKLNTGLTDSLNFGLNIARGSWIARLDADDLCEPTRLERQISFVRNHPTVVLVGSEYIEIDECGARIKEQTYPASHHYLTNNLHRMKRFFPHSSAFIKTDAIQKAGYYNPHFKKSQDWDLWLRLADIGEVRCMKEFLVKVRKHSNQISSDYSGVSQLVYGYSASICHFLRTNNVPDPSIGGDCEAWNGFLFWVESSMTSECVFRKRSIWYDARKEYFSTSYKIISAFRFATRLLQSGYLTILLWEKLFGSLLPQKLAKRWAEEDK